MLANLILMLNGLVA